jgi:opacity protein-like surface antigen
MAKKSLAVLAVAVLAAGGVFAQTAFGISAGAGGLFISDFGGGLDVSGNMGGQPISMKMESPNFGGGGYIFVDARYAELTVAVYGGSGTSKTTQTDRPDSESDMTSMNLNIGLLGKYPIAVNSKLTLFPLLGIDYAVCLSAKGEDGNDLEGLTGEVVDSGDFSALWFKFGGGLDFALTQNLYLRFEALYGIRLANTYEKDMKDMVEDSLGTDVEVKTLLGHGLTAKLAVGYRF